jgi:CheY-like chemotaxis protein
VLVVDDDLATRRLLAATLRTADIEVVRAGSGLQALELMGHQSFAAVVLDIHMPGMSGLEVLRHLRSRPATATLPVILVTGDDRVADRVHGLEAGANDYIAKPFDPDELVARVRAQLRWNSLWVETIQSHQRERSVLALAPPDVTSAAGASELAKLVCAGLAAVDDFSGAGLLGILTPEIVIPLATVQLESWHVPTTGTALPRTLARYLVDRATRGPWLENLDKQGASDFSGGPAPEMATLACAPVHHAGQPVGLLLLEADPASGRPSAPAVARALSEAIDFAEIVSGLLGPSLDGLVLLCELVPDDLILEMNPIGAGRRALT